jgi:surface antigen Omp85-like protein/surface antigen-like variable number repeat protein
VYLPASPARFLLALACLGASPFQHLAAHPQDPPPATQKKSAAPASDLDVFMEKVLARREVNRATLNQYVLDETETFEILGPGRWPLHRMKREFSWYAQDGMHIRSPVRFDGVAVGEEPRRSYERNWIRRERERQERKAKNEREKKSISLGPEGVQVTGTETIPTEPRFVSEAYFMDFKFEPGNYYLAGREKLEGQDVLRIEYYPTHLFNDEDDEKTPREIKKKPSKTDRREEKLEQDIDRKMNKTALVTLWVDPAEHQIVKYTFDNMWLDFLPGAWLVRIDDLRASMTMGQPFPGVWLPRGMNIHAGVTLAAGSFEAGYSRTFSQYRLADVKTTIKVPKDEHSPFDSPEPSARSGPSFDSHEPDARSGPFVDDEQAVETIREIRVHGNASLADEEVLKLAGIAVGDPVPAEALKGIERRLKDSDRFETVEVRKRYRSLDDPTDVAIVLVVHERPGVTSGSAGGIKPPWRPWRRMTSRLMFLPILNFTDGYGFTYGGRVSTQDLLGAGERLSVPLTWGGTKRAAIEFERTFKHGPLTRVLSSFGIWNRKNPHFEIDDQRVELKARAERQFAHVVRLGVDGTSSSVSFGQIDDRLWTFGANGAIDTRGDPAFPGNAVVLGGGWSALNVNGLPKIDRYTADARGYLRVTGQSVVAGRVQYFNTDASLPPYERLLLGGASTLRGFRAGTFDGDRMMLTSGELRVPITSVISGAKLGLTVFVDAARAVDFGTRLKDGEWHRGAGAGLFIIAPLVKINLDVAHGFHGDRRLHIGSGFSF